MPRSLQEIIDSQEKLAVQFEDYEPRMADERDPGPLQLLRRGVAARVDAERQIVAAVIAAREANYSWASIGALLGTSGEAVRQRYGQLVSH